MNPLPVAREMHLIVIISSSMPNSLKVGWWATESKQPLNAYCPVIGKFITTIEDEEGGMFVVRGEKLERLPRLPCCVTRRAHNEEIRRKG
jgi:hypothetical protein